VSELRRRDVVREGDLVILTMGEPLQKPGGTNSMKILRVGSHLTVD
jgi:pyruvate kinase